MRRIYILCLLGLFFFSGIKVYAYDFQSGGIYFNILDGNNVEVTMGDTKYEGNIEISGKVAHNGKSYNVTSIGKSAFSYCSGLTSISIPNSVTSIADYAFQNCSGLTSISIPKSVTSIGNYAFHYCSGLISISIPNSLTSIGDYAFECCSGLNSITIPNSVTNIGNGAFSLCKGLTSISIPNSVTSVGNYAFAYCSGLTSISIPSSVTSIGNSAFSGCSGLTSISIPNSVMSIGNEAFSYCSGFKDIVSEIKTPFAINENAFSDYSKPTLTVPSGTKSAYQSTAGWNKFTNIVEAYGGNTSTKRTIHVATAGTLSNLISESEKYTIEELTLSGELNGTDFRLLRDMAGCNYLGQNTSGRLKVLDIANARIVVGGEKYLDTNNIKGNAVNSTGSFHYNISQENFIPERVLYGCYISTIYIPNSVTGIGNEAFFYCRDLTSITIPNSVTSIGNSAFYGCRGLTSIIIPNSVTSIGNSAFNNCLGLTSISIPNSVTSIGEWAFSNCSGLTSIKVESGNTIYDSRNNCNAIIRKSNNELIAGCKNTIIPNSVTSIGEGAFGGCSSLFSISIPNSITSIGNSAFNNCLGLTSISIPNSVTSIDNKAFYGCSGLTSITIPNSVTSIGNNAFYGCSGLTSITIPNSVTSIGNYAFWNCSGLKDIFSEIKTPFEINLNVFSVHSTATLTVPDGTKSAYQSTAGWYFFTNIVEASGDNTSTKRTIHVATAGTLPNLISKSDKYTIEELTLTGELNGTDFRLLRDMAGGGFSYIYDYDMFDDASNGKLTYLDISGAKIVSGGDAYIAYYDKGQNPRYNDDAEPLYYYLSSSDMIPKFLFRGCKLTSVILPNNLISIGYAAFMECRDLTSIIIPNSVTSIGNYAFNRCIGLTSITIPNSVTTIGYFTFSECTSLKSITIPNSVTSIGECAFQKSSGLMSIKVEIGNNMYDSRNSCNAIIETSSNKLITGCKNTIIPNTVKSIGNFAFYSCSGLTSIMIPNSVTTIGDYAFYNCSGLVSITIPNSVTSIGKSAFYECSGLTSITISNAVTTIGDYAFQKCSGLTSITIPNSVTSIGNSAFEGCNALSSVYSLIEVPFEISSTTFSTYDDATLYVPKDTKQKYLATRFWYRFSKIDDGTEYNYDKEREVFVSIAGTLTNYISESEKYYIEKLTLKGELNGADFRLLREMAGNNDLGKETGGRLCFLDMSEARIVHGGGNYLNSRSISYDGGMIIDIGILHTSIEQDDELSDLIFAGCMSLKEVILPQSTISIGNSSFWACINLVSIIIPNSVISISRDAFYGCSGLTSIVSEIVKPFEINSTVFPDYSKPTLTVPYGTKSAYQSTAGWNKFTNIIEAEADNTFGKVADVVDLGLSVKWASWNIGASKIGDYGGLYGAGDPTGQKTSTNYSDYYFKNGESICNTDYDLAHVKWGEKWRMPTFEELKELRNKCTWSKGEVDGVQGSWVKGPNGNSIFLPCAGYREGNTIKDKDDKRYGFYWSGDMGASSYEHGYKDLDIYLGGVLKMDGGENYMGQSIRPVYGDSNNGSNTSTKRTIHVATAGTLPNLISESEKYFIEELTLTGELNGTDFRLLRDMAGSNYKGQETAGKLTVLDFSGAKVVAGGDNYVEDTNSLAGVGGTFTYTVDKNDILPRFVFAGCKFISIIISNSVTGLGDYVFSSCSGLTSITLPSSVTSIGYSAFTRCTSLTSITIPNSVTSIGDYVFWDCSSLTSITIPNSMTSISNYAFWNCSGLTSITIPGSVTSIGNSAFGGCGGLTSITIPSSVTSIGYSAFESCYGLTSITIPSSVTSIGTSPFRGCSGLSSIIVENGNTKYDSRNNCNAIIEKETNNLIAGCMNTTIPSSVTSIGNSAFGGCTGLTSITIPKSVTSIGDGAFLYCSGLASIKVENGNTKYDSRNNCNAIIEKETNNLIIGCMNTTIPSSVTSIGDDAFYGCSGMTSIMIPSSVTTIGVYAFLGCSGLTSITIPNSVTSIYGGAFRDCSGLTSITIPNSVTSIGNSAFDGCSGLTSITIPNSVTSIDKWAFSSCSGLKDIISEIETPFEINENVFSVYSTATLTVPNGTKSAYQSTAGWNKFTNIVEASGGNTSTKRTIHVVTAGTLPNLISESEKYTIEKLTLTGELNGTDFRLLRDMAGFNYLGEGTQGKLKVLNMSGARIVKGGEKYLDADHLPGWDGSTHFSYTIEESDKLPQHVFHGCKFTAFMIPNSVTSIGNYAFQICDGLTSITIPSSVTSIGDYAFSSSGLTSIMIPNSVTSIGDWAFTGCSDLTSITIPNSVTSIGDGAFSYCSGLTSIMIPNSVTSIGDYAFSFCSGLTSISIPNSVTSIGNSAFSSCSGLTSISIPNSVTSIGSQAFYYCSGLTSISIPNSVTSIGNYAFYNCRGLKDVISEIKTPFEISENVFSVYSTAKLTVPSGTKSAYQSTAGWNKFTNIVESINSGDNTGTKRAIHVATAGTLPNLILESEKYTIEELTLTGELNGTDFRLLRDMAGCNYLGDETSGQLKVLDISETRVVIGGERYVDTDHLPGWGGSFRYTVDKNDVLPQWIFAGCKFTSVSIPNSVTSIGEWAFYSCSGLTSISIPNSVTSIGDEAFRGCSGLTSISIPNSVTSIGSYAFYYCSGLTSISIPNSVTSIGNSAFSYCGGLKDVISEIKTPFEISENVFSVYSTAKLTVPSGTKSAYLSTAGWNKFTNIVEKEADNIIQGDTNGDKEVNVSDIVEVVNFIMNNASSIFLKANADLNGDGEVNVTDIVMMVNIIMSAQTSAARRMSNRVGSMLDGDCLTIDDVIINAGETKQVNISLNNPDKKYTAFQFDLTLPEGITIAKNSNGKLMASLDTERKDDHTLNVSELGNNTYRFLAFSMSNAELCGTSGPLVNITLEADGNMDSGTNAAALKSQVFTATDGTQYKWSDLPFSIKVNRYENTGIDEISQNGQKGGMIKVYTLTGLLLFSVPQSEFSEKWQVLPSGVYIVNGQKNIKTNDAY